MSGPGWISRTLPSTQVANIVCVGDSLTQENAYCTTPQTWVYLLGGAGAAYGGLGAPANQGVSGNTIADMRARKATWNALYDGTKAQNILFVMGGTNDMSDPVNVPATISALAGLCADALAAHPWLIYIQTIFDAIPRAPNFDAARLQYNALIHKMYLQWGAVGVVDPGLAAGMLASGAPNSGTYFGGDHEHPNPNGNVAMTVEQIAGLKRTAIYL